MASAPLEYNQSSFREGFNRGNDTTKTPEGAYPLLINGRVRDDVIDPVMKPLLLDAGLPLTYNKCQGLYASDTFSIVFIDGSAYYRTFALEDSQFVKINGFAMSATVDTIYAELVPTSSMNFSRKAPATGNFNDPVFLYATANSSPACVVCQDGINQPLLILYNGTVLTAQTFDQWSTDVREYVPIGKQMVYVDGVLYIAKPDGSGFYRSVSGRPLDFVIAVDVNGNKLSAAAGDANATSHSVTFETITALSRINSNEGGFIVCTLKNTWMVVPDRTTLIYGEPGRFRNQYLFNTGALNQFALCELSGDVALIDINAIRSFNAVLNVRNEGKNSVFSRDIDNLFSHIEQPTTCCAFQFDNYAMFSVLTVYGAAVMLYDTTTQKFVGLDIYEGVEAITQFAEIKVGSTRKLLFRTTDHKIYEAFASTEFENTQLYLGDFTSGNPKCNQKPEQIQCVFLSPKQAGIVYASVYVDGKKQCTLKEVIKETVSDAEDIPFSNDTVDSVKTLSYNCSQANSGWKLGVLLSWDFDVKLAHIRIEATKEISANSYESQAVDYPRYSGATNISLEGFAPLSGVVGNIVVVTGMGFANVSSVLLGEVTVSFTLIDDNALTFNVPAGAPTGKIRLITPYDEVDSDIDFTVN